MRSRLLDVEADGVDLVGSAANRRPFALFKAGWTTAFVNGLPDSSFAYVEAGADKDKSKRHLPYKDASGKVDLPHLRNALARLDQTQIPAAAKAAARRKLEAAAKQAGVGAPAGKSRNRGGPMKVKATKAAFRTHLEKLGVAEAADLTDEELLEKAAAVGYELVERTGPEPEPEPEPQPEPTPEPSEAQKSALRKFFEAMGLLTPQATSPLDKAKLDPATREYVTGLEKRLKAQEDARIAETRAALTKRATDLQKQGWLAADTKPETLPEAEVAALEKARDRITARLKDAGVLESFGTLEKADDETTLREQVYKAVCDYLGREPTGKIEEVQVRKKIYEANPGLAAAVRAEERTEREGQRA